LSSVWTILPRQSRKGENTTKYVLGTKDNTARLISAIEISGVWRRSRTKVWYRKWQTKTSLTPAEVLPLPGTHARLCLIDMLTPADATCRSGAVDLLFAATNSGGIFFSYVRGYLALG